MTETIQCDSSAGRRQGHGGRVLWPALFAGVSLLLAGAAGRADEPQLSTGEAALLRQAQGLAGSDIAGAMAVIAKARTPESSAALDFAFATYAVKAGNPSEAMAALREALRKLPDFHRARTNLAKVLLQLSRPAEAAAELRILLGDSHGGAGEVWELLGYALLSDGHPAAAEAAYRQALVRDPDSAIRRVGLIKALVEQDRLDAARPLVRAELRRQPARGELWSVLANAELRAEHRERALILLECARRLGVAGPQVAAALGDLYLDQGMPEQALAAYGESVAHPGAPTMRVLNAVSAMAALGHVDAAEALLARVAPREQAMDAAQRLELARVRAETAALRGDSAEAIAHYRALLKQNPLDAEALLALGALLLAQDKSDDALALYQRASLLPGYRARGLVGQAQAAVRRERYADAVVWLEEALDLKPDRAVEQYLKQVRQAAAGIAGQP